jgi:hypothetical protein
MSKPASRRSNDVGGPKQDKRKHKKDQQHSESRACLLAQPHQGNDHYGEDDQSRKKYGR